MESKSTPLVSVVMPAWNCEKTITRAIDSALAQDVPVEVIVIDDCSPDGLLRIMERYAEDPRVVLLRNEQNRGAAESRNRGVREARGPFVAFLDADDWWEEGKLSAQLRKLKEEQAVLCCTGRELMDAEGNPLRRIIPAPEHISYRSLLFSNCINCSSVLIRTEAAREFPMEHDEAHEDYLMWLRILKKYRRAAGIAHPYLKYRVAAGSKSGNKLKSARMTWKVYRCMGYGPLISSVFFCGYAVNGVWKYFGRRHWKQ